MRRTLTALVLATALMGGCAHLDEPELAVQCQELQVQAEGPRQPRLASQQTGVVELEVCWYDCAGDETTGVWCARRCETYTGRLLPVGP